MRSLSVGYSYRVFLSATLAVTMAVALIWSRVSRRIALVLSAFSLAGGRRRCRAVGAAMLLFAGVTAFYGAGLPYIAVREEGALSVRKDQVRYARALSARIGNDPRRFMKLAAADVRLLLDAPGLARTEGSVAVWQYRSDSCVLDIYFSAGPDGKAQRVVDYEVRPRIRAALGGALETAYEDEKACFRSILATQRPAPRPAGRVVVASLT